MGTNNVYFQPPANVQMQYPCIVYQRDNARTESADNNPYRVNMRYQITVIDRDPDSLVPAKVAELSTSTLNRTFVANNLHHDVFTLYY